jgi:hypothetical protein
MGGSVVPHGICGGCLRLVTWETVRMIPFGPRFESVGFGFVAITGVGTAMQHNCGAVLYGDVGWSIALQALIDHLAMRTHIKGAV